MAKFNPSKAVNVIEKNCENLYLKQNTPHLNEKKLSMNSSWDFEYVLDTVDDY